MGDHDQKMQFDVFYTYLTVILFSKDPFKKEGDNILRSQHAFWYIFNI